MKYAMSSNKSLCVSEGGKEVIDAELYKNIYKLIHKSTIRNSLSVEKKNQVDATE